MKPETRRMHSRGKHKDAGSWDPNLGESAVRTRWVEKKNAINFTWILRQTLKKLHREGPELRWEQGAVQTRSGGRLLCCLLCIPLAISEKNTTLKPKAKQRFSKIKPIDDVDARTQFPPPHPKTINATNNEAASCKLSGQLEGPDCQGARFH